MTFLTSEALTWIYGAALAQAGLLTVALASLRVRNGAARWLLVATLGTYSILLGEEFLEEIGHGPGIGIGLALEFALPPLLYLFMTALKEGGKPAGRLWPHFLPLAAASLALVWLNLGFESHWVSLANPAMRPVVAGIVFAKIGYFLIYAAVTLKRLRPEAFGARRNAAVALRRLMAVFIAGYLLSAASFLAYFLKVPWAPDSDEIGGIVMATAIYAIGYFSLVARQIFDAVDPYRASPMPAHEAAALRARAEQALNSADSYRNPDYSLGDLARTLGVGEARLSQALNAQQSGGFLQMLNARRLTAYQEAAREAVNRGRTVLDLAYEVGFNSKATFYRVFKAAEGITPMAHRAKHD